VSAIGFGTQPGATRLFVAARGSWRGYFILDSWAWNPADADCPVTLIFDPCTWTRLAPQPAPPRPPRHDYTLATPLP
jgi:hypothetical protein